MHEEKKIVLKLLVVYAVATVLFTWVLVRAMESTATKYGTCRESGKSADVCLAEVFAR